MDRFALIGYSLSFVSFALPELKNVSIKDIILFGSVARGDFDEKSDIDLFFDLEREEDGKKAERIVATTLKRFYKSRIFETWGLKGIKNEISAKFGVLEKWKLKRSILSDGILLYGKYRQLPKGARHYTLFVFEPIKNVTVRNRIIRKVIGRKEKSYSKEGMLKEMHAVPLSQRVIVVPSEHSNKLLAIFSKEKVDYKMFELWSDQF